MICPSCKGENPALAVRCRHCEAMLQASGTVKSEDTGKRSSGESDSNPLANIPPSTRWDPDADRRIDSPVLSAGYQAKEGPNVSIISKTPSGSTPPDDRTIDSSDPGRLRTGEEATPKTAGTSSPSRRSSGTGRELSSSLGAGRDFGPRFRIEKLLGAGGMGKVYKAFDKELSRMVALKTLQPELVSDPLLTERFKQELLLASKISHRNILRIHDLSEVDGVKYISMAFIEGKDLHQLMKSEGPFPLERSLNIAKQLCEALDAAHSEGVVHRDFKPQNVLVAKDDHAYVSDFGLATSFETAKMGMTRTGALVGTPRYMSPEQVEGKPVDSRADIYALGLVFYEMVTGEVPFSGGSTWQSMYQRVQQMPKDVKLVNPALPEYVARVIMHCLEKDPANRYQSVKNILADLDTGRGPSLSTTGRVQINLPVFEKRWWYAAAAGGLLLIGLFFAIPKTRHWVFATPDVGTLAPGSNGPPSISQVKFVAVLPFRVLGDQSSLEYVADGLVEALSAKLFQLKDVRLASQVAAAKTDPKTPLSEVAKQLGVNLIVHGTVQGSGDNLRVTVNLDNVAENRLVWSQEFPGVTGDLLTIEDHIYATLVDALALKPSNAEQARATAHPTQNIEAYEFYLKGRNALRGQQDLKNVRSAIGFFEEALKKDSSFALAYAGVADASLVMYRETNDSSWSAKALGAAQQARALGEDQPEIHLALGSVYRSSGRTAEAIVELKRALELAPNSDEAYLNLAAAYLASGRSSEAIQNFQKAVELNPYYWVNHISIGNAYYQLGDYGKAADSYRRVIELDPKNPYAYDNLGVVLVQSGKFREALEPFEKSLQFSADGQAYSNLGIAYFYLKDYNKAISAYEKAVQLVPTSDMFVGNLAEAYDLVGQKDRAQATFEKAISLAYKELQVNPRDANTKGRLALWYGKKGDVRQALKFIAEARAIDPNNVDLIYYQAQAFALANDNASALVALRDAFKKGQAPAIAQAEPDLQSLQKDPDFQKLVTEYTQPN
jgi:serine/threonine protein kinase/tetratricopeptide (TPR) repeat protein/TolB-like protein